MKSEFERKRCDLSQHFVENRGKPIQTSVPTTAVLFEVRTEDVLKTSLHLLRLQDRRISQARNRHQPGSNKGCLCYPLPVASFLEDAGDMFFRNVCRLSSDYTALYLRGANVLEAVLIYRRRHKSWHSYFVYFFLFFKF
jgi:hypothetical protein